MFGRTSKVTRELRSLDVDAILGSPELVAIGDRLAAGKLERSRELAAQLAALELGTKGGALAKAADEAELGVAKAKAALEAAQAARALARAAWSAESSRVQHARNSLERQLRALADERFELFAVSLDEIFERARVSFAVDVRVNDPAPTEDDAARLKRLSELTDHELARARMQGWVAPRQAEVSRPKAQIVTNGSVIERLLELLRALRDAARAAQLEALARDDATRRLNQLCDSLRAPLSGIGLLPPIVTGDDVVSAPSR